MAYKLIARSEVVVVIIFRPLATMRITVRAKHQKIGQNLTKQ